MGYTVIHDGIIFDEGIRNNVVKVGNIEADLSFKIGAQLKNLRDVKTDLARKARSMNANLIINFTYGQKSRWLAIDDVAFWGKGIACRVSQEEYDSIVNKLKSV